VRLYGDRELDMAFHRIVFVNKMDRVGADFYEVERQIKDRLNGNPVPIQIPIGAEDEFEGIIDLVKMKEIVWDKEAEMGSAYHEQDIRPELQEKADEYREKMIEEISSVDCNEELMEKYMEGEELTKKEMVDGIKKATVNMEIGPNDLWTGFKIRVSDSNRCYW